MPSFVPEMSASIPLYIVQIIYIALDIYTYMYIYIYIYIYTHTHTHNVLPKLTAQKNLERYHVQTLVCLVLEGRIRPILEGVIPLSVLSIE
jgi:hypothetical protein